MILIKPNKYLSNDNKFCFFVQVFNSTCRLIVKNISKFADELAQSSDFLSH